MKTYYQILEIPENANDGDIKKAFRRLAKEYHPDKGSETAEHFKQIKEAYEVLKDPNKRNLHDKKINPSRVTPARTRKGSNISIILKVSLTDLIGGISKTIITNRSNICPTCLGTGTTKKTLDQCPKCSGNGIDIVSAVVGPRKFCAHCKGYGSVAGALDCPTCQGTGLINESVQKTITLNRDNPDKITIKDLGNYSFGGGLPGDLIITLVCENKTLFEISGKSIKGILPISPAQAVLGDVIFMDVFNNLLKITVPAGTEPDSIIEQENVPFGSGKGKLVLKVQLQIPKDPNIEERNLYTQLLKLQKGFL